MKSYPGLPASGRQYHVMYIPLDLNTTMLAKNNRITLSKESATKTLSNLEDA